MARVLDAHAGLYQDEDDGLHPYFDVPADDVDDDGVGISSLRTLTNIVMYLRITHSLDFFSGFQLTHEDAMAQRLVYITVPEYDAPPPAQSTSNSNSTDSKNNSSESSSGINSVTATEATTATDDAVIDEHPIPMPINSTTQEWRDRIDSMGDVSSGYFFR